MGRNIERGLVGLLATLTAVAALLSETDPSTLNVDAITWNWVVLSLAVSTLVVTGATRFFDS